MQIGPATLSFPQSPTLDPASDTGHTTPWRDRRFFNLPQHRNPVVNASYQARSISRPGTVAEWATFIGRVAQLVEELYRDARVMTGKRQQMRDHRADGPIYKEAQRIYNEMHKRAVKHCQDLAHTLLATGLPREHIDGHLTKCGMEYSRQPEYGIAVLYSKLMGIPFREERLVPVFGNSEGDVPARVVVEDRRVQWAQQIDPKDLDDFFWTMRTLNDQLPSLLSKFHRSISRASGTLGACAAAA